MQEGQAARLERRTEAGPEIHAGVLVREEDLGHGHLEPAAAGQAGRTPPPNLPVVLGGTAAVSTVTSDFGPPDGENMHFCCFSLPTPSGLRWWSLVTAATGPLHTRSGLQLKPGQALFLCTFLRSPVFLLGLP